MPLQENAWITNLKNLDLDLIWTIFLKCGYFGFMIPFLYFAPPPKKKEQNLFLDSRIRFSHPQFAISLAYGSAWCNSFKQLERCIIQTWVKFSFSFLNIDFVGNKMTKKLIFSDLWKGKLKKHLHRSSQENFCKVWAKRKANQVLLWNFALILFELVYN